MYDNVDDVTKEKVMLSSAYLTSIHFLLDEVCRLTYMTMDDCLDLIRKVHEKETNFL